MWVASRQRRRAPRGGLQTDRQTPAQKEAAENGGVRPCPRAWCPWGVPALVTLSSPDRLIFSRCLVRVYFPLSQEGAGALEPLLLSAQFRGRRAGRVPSAERFGREQRPHMTKYRRALLALAWAPDSAWGRGRPCTRTQTRTRGTPMARPALPAPHARPRLPAAAFLCLFLISHGVAPCL